VADQYKGFHFGRSFWSYWC